MSQTITITPEDAALDTMEGDVNSYVRKARATIKHVSGQVMRAKHLGIPDSVIWDRLRKGITDPPNADPDRVAKIVRRFLS